MADPLDPTSVAYFGLRTNAHQLIAGAGVNAVRRRIKLAALLHDRVVLEHGIYSLTAGGGVSVPMYMTSPAEGQDWRWQTARQRHPRGQFTFSIRSDSAPADEPYRQMAQGEVHLRWAATLVPFMAEMPRPYEWILSAYVEDGSEVRRLTAGFAREDGDDPRLVSRWPDRFVRNSVAAGAATDFLRVATAEPETLVLYPDPFHSALLQARIARGQAAVMLGSHALEVIDPRELSWEEVHWLRQEVGWSDFRKVMSDIEAEARSAEHDLGDLEQRILRVYQDRLDRARRRMPSHRARLGSWLVGLVIGELSGQVLTGSAGGGLVGSVVGGMFGDAAGAAIDSGLADRTRPRWVAADDARKRLGHRGHPPASNDGSFEGRREI